MGFQNEPEGIVEVIQFNPTHHSPCGDPGAQSCDGDNLLPLHRAQHCPMETSMLVSSDGGHVALEHLKWGWSY